MLHTAHDVLAIRCRRVPRRRPKRKAKPMRTISCATLARALVILVNCLATAGPAVATDRSAFSVVSVLHDDRAFNRPHDVILQGDLAFVPGKGGSIAIVDVADPTAPRVLWSKLDPEELVDAETVLVVGNHLMLGTKDFFSLDIRRPARPVRLTAISDRTRVDRINGMVRRGEHVFAACKHGWVAVFDIRSPAAPRLVDAIDLRKRYGFQCPHDIDAFGDHIVVVDPDYFGRDGNPGKIGVWRVADPKTHTLMACDRWVLEGRVVSHDLVGANRVQVRGNHAYVAGSQHEKPARTAVVDVTDPARPRLAAVMPFSDVRGSNGLTVVGNVLFSAGGQTIEAIDISNPNHAIKMAAEKLLDVFPVGRDDAHDLVYRQGYLYVTAQNSNRFAILKVNSPRVLELAAECDRE